MSGSEQYPVGIDLGTTRTVVAHLDGDGRPCTLPNAEGDLTTPSVIFFDGENPVVGKEAIKAAEFEPDRVAQFVKRSMGDPFFERPVAGRRFPPEVLQSLILRKVKADAEMKIGPIQQAVITVPAYFNEPRRKATQDAGRLIGLDVIDIINEPTAAAISFGIQRGFLNARGESERQETVLVYDLGGGTFDATLMHLDGHQFRAIATAGDVYLGGVDWDLRIVGHVAEKFREKFGIDPRENEQARQILLAEAEDAKHALSARSSVNIQFAFDGNRLRVPLTRDEFEELTGELVDRTILTVRRLLREAKLEWSQLTRLLLVGGSTRMPMIPQALERESGLTADRSLSPDEAVAHGAAIYAGLLAKEPHVVRRGMSVINVNSHDLGVLGIERDTGMQRRKVLIPRNTPLPATGAKKFTTHRAGQSSVKVAVVEGGDAAGKNATSIGHCLVSDLPPNLPAGSPVNVSFNYATNGRLTVGASLPGTGRHARLVIERTSGLTDEVIAAWTERIAAGRFFEAAVEGAHDEEIPEAIVEPADDDAIPPDAAAASDSSPEMEVEDFAEPAPAETKSAPAAPAKPAAEKPKIIVPTKPAAKPAATKPAAEAPKPIDKGNAELAAFLKNFKPK